MSQAALEQARAHFEAGELRECRQVALEALASRPDDIELLRLAGRAGVELGATDGVDHLRRVAELRPDEAESWRDLGDALAAEGRGEEASRAFSRAVELDPHDEVSLTALGHSAYAAGEGDDAVELLERAAERAPAASTAVISLVEVYKALGKHDDALAAAERVAEAVPHDVLAQLDVAELSLRAGRLERASEAFERIRAGAELPDDEVYALHGMIAVEFERGDAERARELAREAKAIDGLGRTTGVLAHLEAEAGTAPSDLPADASATFIAALETPPSRGEVIAALHESLRELRRLHAGDLRLSAEDVLA
jgi:Flp pilus assembly protein TadD